MATTYKRAFVAKRTDLTICICRGNPGSGAIACSVPGDVSTVSITASSSANSTGEENELKHVSIIAQLTATPETGIPFTLISPVIALEREAD
jgi:hypothetical protein